MPFRLRHSIVFRLLLVASALIINAGCLRNRRPADEAGFRDHPAMPRQNFGRRSEEIGQLGLDPRTREIESSLGIDGEPRRLLDR